MTTVLILSFGPVQDFIAAARRSRDLWSGSWLLSEVCKAAALALYRAVYDPQPAIQENGTILEPSPRFGVLL